MDSLVSMIGILGGETASIDWDHIYNVSVYSTQSSQDVTVVNGIYLVICNIDFNGSPSYVGNIVLFMNSNKNKNINISIYSYITFINTTTFRVAITYYSMSVAVTLLKVNT